MTNEQRAAEIVKLWWLANDICTSSNEKQETDDKIYLEKAITEALDKKDAAAEKLVVIVKAWLEDDMCRETSCPWPTRAMCSNPRHQCAREALAAWEGSK